MKGEVERLTSKLFEHANHYILEPGSHIDEDCVASCTRKSALGSTSVTVSYQAAAKVTFQGSRDSEHNKEQSSKFFFTWSTHAKDEMVVMDLMAHTDT